MIFVCAPNHVKAFWSYVNPTVYLTANPSSIQYGQSSNLSWNSSNATSCSTSWNGNIGTYNSTLVYPTSTTTYNITCYSYNGQQASSSVTVYVNNYTNYYSTYQNYNNYQNNNNQLFVTTSNATNITNSSAILNGLINANGSYTTAWFTYGTSTNFLSSTTQTLYNSGFSNYNVPISGLIPNTTYYFRLAAQSPQGIVYGNTLSFNTMNDYTNSQPTVALSADNTNLAYNEVTNIRWYTTNATYCYASNGSNGWAGVKNVDPSAFYTGSLTENKTYTITCSNNIGSSTDSVTVNVHEKSTVITNPETASTSTANSPANKNTNIPLSANVFESGFMPTSIIGWFILVILVLVLILLTQYIFYPKQPTSSSKKSH